jgi:hypothetical protein
MSGTTKIAVLAAVILAVPVVLVAAAVAGVATMLGGGGTYCATTGSTNTAAAGLRPEQMTNAATIVAVGKQLSVPPQGWVVAIAAALQESDLVNLEHGDQDSLGLFQQRPSQGWGTPTQIMNPTYAATQFYRHLLAVPNWQQMTVNDAAQAVERSAVSRRLRPARTGSATDRRGPGGRHLQRRHHRNRRLRPHSSPQRRSAGRDQLRMRATRSALRLGRQRGPGRRFRLLRPQQSRIRRRHLTAPHCPNPV